MATGYTHRQVSLRLIIPTSLCIGLLAAGMTWYFAQNIILAAVAFPWYALVAGLGATFAAVCTPDEDIQHRTWEEKQLQAKFPRFGLLWEVYWYPYARLFKHRGLSHLPGYGAFTRLVYTFWPLGFVTNIGGLPAWWNVTWLVWLPVWFGMLGPDIAHALADVDTIGDVLERRYRGAGFARWYNGYRMNRRIAR